MTAPSSPVPAWLRKAHDHEHTNTVLRVLAEREHARNRARHSSQNRNNVSLRHRLSILPPSLSPQKNQLTEHYSVAVGSEPGHQFCNRYMDIMPYDRTRVIIGGRYFNADWVRERMGGHLMIATQAPLPHTAHDFLSVIASAQGAHVRTVVQLTRNIEAGRQKAHIYFPSYPGQSWIIQPNEENRHLAPFQVTLLKTEAVDSAHCTISTVSVSEVVSGTAAPPVIFQHMLYAAWPDHGVPEPEDRAGLLEFIQLVDQRNRAICNVSTPEAERPIMVNCSAGVGRTGSFIALSSLLRAHGILGFNSSSPPPMRTSVSPLAVSPLGPLPEAVEWDEVAQEIDALREQRPGMVQREEQALLIYDVLIAAFMGKARAQESS
ncbi:hypothetical protein EWM64_g2194 [Hericium alpestre]|uniref:Tyrosine specific protein phosphatases domain-containing protein n=1 Tax=Hericium alpestre TaxID=135208 RepID=A0A4Z0A6D8_9AGAM|nr:hypothetical protein EWM64_g2194 [Hericium alpestre]